jgi:hypothetical protein
MRVPNNIRYRPRDWRLQIPALRLPFQNGSRTFGHLRVLDQAFRANGHERRQFENVGFQTVKLRRARRHGFVAQSVGFRKARPRPVRQPLATRGAGFDEFAFQSGPERVAVPDERRFARADGSGLPGFRD